jgi:hypothetical protein
VQFEELRYICQEAALDVLRSRGRPVPPTVVLPRPDRTRLLTLPGFPDDDELRHAVLAQVALDEVTAERVPCWGFVAEAEVGGEDAVVVAFGARRHTPHVTASGFDEDGQLSEFAPSEELDPSALPFLHPLQHAVDALPSAAIEAAETDVFGRGSGGDVGGGLPLHPG